jgi:hypothetical protein
MNVLDSARPVLARLESLGSASAIAAFLSNEGIVGDMESSFRCPIALYLLRETGTDWLVGSDTVRTVALNPAVYQPDIPFGPNVRQFIVSFDHGAFPDLVRDWMEDPPVFV